MNSTVHEWLVLRPLGLAFQRKQMLGLALSEKQMPQAIVKKRKVKEAAEGLERCRRPANQVLSLGLLRSLHTLICLKNALPRTERPHFAHRRTTRACLRRGTSR